MIGKKGRIIQHEMLLKDIVLDEELYPRNGYNWQTAYDYSQSMEVGETFPRVVVAKYNNVFVLVDGKHRIEARKIICGKKKFEEFSDIVDVILGLTREEIFAESVKRNIKHGRSLSPQEKMKIALKLQEMKFGKEDISRIVQIPQGKLRTMIGKRMVNTITGEPIIVKKTFESLVDVKKPIAGSIDAFQSSFGGSSQINLIEELLALIKTNTIDLKNPKVKNALSNLKTALTNFKGI